MIGILVTLAIGAGVVVIWCLVRLNRHVRELEAWRRHVARTWGKEDV